MNHQRKIWIIVCEAILCFMCLFYPHMDANLFWKNPILYFKICNYGHNFIFSTQCGLIWLLIPLFAYITINYDVNNVLSFLKMITKGILEFTIFFSIFVFIIIFSSNSEITDSSWQTVARAHAYGKLAENNNMPFYTLFCYFRIVINLIIWQFIIGILRLFTNNSSIGFIYTLIITYIWHCFSPNEWNYSIWSVPPIDYSSSLEIITINNIIFLFAICITYYVLYNSVEVIKQFKMLLYQKIGAEYITTIFLCLITPLIMNCGFHDLFTPGNSIYNIWLSIFGGIEWGHPEIIVEYAYRNTICYLLPFMYKQEKCEYYEYSMKFTTIKKTLSRLFMYCLCCVFIETISVLKRGNSISLIFYPDMSFYNLLISFCLLFIHILIFDKLNCISKYITSSSEISQMIWLIPFCGTLLASNEDRIINIYIPTNWPMIIRSDAYSPHFISEVIADGSIKIYELATFSSVKALAGEFAILIFIYVISWKLKEKKVRN